MREQKSVGHFSISYFFFPLLDHNFQPLSHLLHKDLRIVRHHVSVHHGSKRNVVTSWLDVLVHKLPEILTPQAVD